MCAPYNDKRGHAMKHSLSQDGVDMTLYFIFTLMVCRSASRLDVPTMS